jgi:hypothetical protein
MTVKKVVTAKAEFLINTQIDFNEFITDYRKSMVRAEQMPTRGKRQCQDYLRAQDDARKKLEHHLLMVGYNIWGTFNFVSENKKLLPVATRKKLFGEKK